MTKREYSILLQDKRWIAKRKVILERDNNCCTKCSSTKLLHVHHKKYIDGNKPWEVPNKYLETLCSKCHLLEHKGKSIHSFIIKSKKKVVAKKGGERYNKLKQNGKIPN